MTTSNHFTWILTAIFAFSLVGLFAPPQAQAEEAPAATAEETDTEDAEATEEEVEEVDPYEVPDGTTEELLEYIETAPQQMRPQSREDLVRMFESLGLAADRVLADEEAEPAQRLTAAQTRLQTLGMLTRVGHPEANAQMEKFIEGALEDNLPEIQALAKGVKLQRQLQRWSELEPAEQEAVVEEMRANLTGEEVARDSIIMLMRFADSVAETDDAEVAIELIGEIVPRLKESDDPQVAARAPALQGLARRLQLPGSEMELEGKLLDGEEVDWESYRGKVVLVDFWATWCGPCIGELPNVLEQYEAYHEKGFEVLGISLDEEAEGVQAFMEDKELPWVTLFSDDPEATGWHHPMATKYGINAIPRAILVDQEGKVVNMNARGPKLGEALGELLGPPAEPEESETDETAEAAIKVGETASIEP